jgi:hypothetical protein
MNYDDQLTEIRSLGIEDKHIRRVRYRTLESGMIAPACEEDKDGTMQEKLYKLNAGRLEEGEFWILRYYDEQGIWQEVIGNEPRELLTPADFLNQMLSELRMYEDIDKLEMLPKALEMLAKAVELNLQGEDHPRHRIKADNLIGDDDSGSAVVPSTESLEAIALAFQAGELMERFSINYRGVMDNARKGVAFQPRQKRSFEQLKPWQKEAVRLKKENPKLTYDQILGELTWKSKWIERNELRKKQGENSYRYKDTSKWVSKSAVLGNLKNLKSDGFFGS